MISFPNPLEEDEQDPDVLKNLTSQSELSGIFNLLMHSLRLITNNKGIYIDEKSIADRRIKHERTSNPVKVFLSEVTAEDSVKMTMFQNQHPQT